MTPHDPSPETSGGSAPASTDDPLALVASYRHLVIVLAWITAVTIFAAIRSQSPAATAPHSHVLQYLTIFVSEWALVYLVWRGLRGRGVPLAALVVRGPLSQAPGTLVLRSILVWALTFGLVGAATALLGLRNVASTRHTLALLAPHGVLESTLWVLLSLTAGICEELVFRGYLLRQMTAWTRRPLLGVVLAGLVFGGAHAYQGWRSCVTIALFGITLGIAAQRLRDLRPGMIAHFGEDVIGGLVGGLLRR